MPSKILHLDTPERRVGSTIATTPTNVQTTPPSTIEVGEPNTIVTPEEVAKYLSVQIVRIVDV